MSEEVLPVLLGRVDDRFSTARDRRTADKLLGIGVQVSPLRKQQVDDVEILTPSLEVTSLSRQEVDVGVAAKPALGIHVAPALQSKLEHLLSRSDRDPLPQRFILESPSDVRDDLAARKPAL